MADVLTALAEACAAHPSQRVLQVIGNVFPGDPFYVENDEAAARLSEYAALGRRNVNAVAFPRAAAFPRKES